MATNIRAALAADPISAPATCSSDSSSTARRWTARASPSTPTVDGLPAGVDLTLGGLHDRVAARAAWLHRYGIGPRDPVAVYARSRRLLLTFLALTWLGAIPALMNPNIPADIAAAYIRRLRGVGVITDARHRRRSRARPRRPVIARPTSRARRPGARRRPTGTTPTTRSPSPTPPAPPGCRPRSCTRTRSLFAATRPSG